MPRSKSTKNARKPRAKRAAKPTFDKRVKAVISRMAENKIQNYRGTVGLRAQTATSWDTTIVPCTPFTASSLSLRGLVKVRGLETQFA